VAGQIRRYAATAERAIAKVQAGQPLDPKTDVLHCRYTVEGAPVPGAWHSFQVDGFGTWLWALNEHLTGAPAEERAAFMGQVLDVVELLVRYLHHLWRHPNADCWEEHLDKVSTSTLGALYGGLSVVPQLLAHLPRNPEAQHDLAALAALASTTAEHIREYVMTHAVCHADGEPFFTKFCGGADPGHLRHAVDANLLWLAYPYGLVPVDHPAMRGTVNRIVREIMRDRPLGSCGLARYAHDEYYGGGEWILLTASLAMVMARSNCPEHRAAAVKFRHWIEAQALEDGALPEQVLHNANLPERISYWEQKWGPAATPLLWSHAKYIVLVEELRALSAEDPAGPAYSL
jgi:GH15 family glucan-1,4-alpha-glucosidase